MVMSEAHSIRHIYFYYVQMFGVKTGRYSIIDILNKNEKQKIPLCRNSSKSQ
jgi:hypothetical protein